MVEDEYTNSSDVISEDESMVDLGQRLSNNDDPSDNEGTSDNDKLDEDDTLADNDTISNHRSMVDLGEGLPDNDNTSDNDNMDEDEALVDNDTLLELSDNDGSSDYDSSCSNYETMDEFPVRNDPYPKRFNRSVTHPRKVPFTRLGSSCRRHRL
jgi:hypothetical protein